MNVMTCEDSKSVARLSSNWCADQIHIHRAKSLFVPAGETPVGLYSLWENEKPKYLDGLRLLQIDDVLTGEKSGVFRQFFAKHLPSYRSHFEPISMADQVADVAILGLGLNGHVAFHEPGLPDSFFSGCVRLSETTCRNLSLVAGTWGITYGAQAFLKCKLILIMAKGRSKRDILKRVLDREPGLPASALMTHPALTVIADREALP